MAQRVWTKQCQNLDTAQSKLCVMMFQPEAQRDESMVCMEYCLLMHVDQPPKARHFKSLWPGQYSKVLACQDIFLGSFAAGGGGACKFKYQERKEWRNKPLLVYAHCGARFPHIGVLIHERQPKLVVEQEIVTRDDGLVHAVSWHYSTSGEYITTKFFYRNVSCNFFDI